MQLDWGSPPDSPAPGVDTPGPLAIEALFGETSPAADAADDRARDDIERYRLAVEAHPDSAAACNNLAWAYVTTPEHLRDASRALALAEKATRLDPHDRLIRNTLGVAYYRVGRYREAADTLRDNLPHQNEKYLAVDLYFLAMSHHQLGDVALAQAYYTWAERATSSLDDLPLDDVQQRAASRAEAKTLMGK